MKHFYLKKVVDRTAPIPKGWHVRLALNINCGAYEAIGFRNLSDFMNNGDIIRCISKSKSVAYARCIEMIGGRG